MSYAIIQPPFTLQFREMPKAELKAYYAWFMEGLPDRIAGLEAAVRCTTGYETWTADFSPESLGPLGEWFVTQVEVRPKTSQELEEQRAKLTFPVDIPTEQLTNRTFSLAMDIGMYFSQVILKNLAGTRWEQPLRNANFADYGQPVVVGSGSVPLNAVSVVTTVAYGIASKERNGRRLRELYDIWVKLLRG